MRERERERERKKMSLKKKNNSTDEFVDLLYESGRHGGISDAFTSEPIYARIIGRRCS
jgi:hypothetical protein